MDAIVSDTTSLIVLARQERLDLLGDCFRQVILPQAVYHEWLAGDASVATKVRKSRCLQVVTVQESELLTELRAMLDAGEAEAIILARQSDLPLLVDEKKGRNVARMMGIPILGLVGLLLLAVQRRALTAEAATAILHQARKHGFRLSDGLYRAFVEHLR